MCGIAALFGLNQSPSLFAKIDAMAKTISHRGPDDEGYAFFCHNNAAAHVYGGPDTPHDVYLSKLSYTPKSCLSGALPSSIVAALGHRRLSIVDISAAGHQPLSTAGGRYWISFNGEVYNYIEVRQTLIQAGHTFDSQTDTEVILKAYQQWGKECLHHFNGMFAFVIFDAQEQKFFAARDRFGVKPLYYWKSPAGYLALASEIKQFTVLPGWNAQINGQRCYDFLLWAVTDHSSETLFANVMQLQGGEFLEAKLTEIKTATPQRWYTLKPGQFLGNFQEASSQFHALLNDAVTLRLRADVDIGSCLSGGLDSSSIVCLANQLLHNKSKQKTFSACSYVKRFDEKNFIDEVIAHTGVDAHYCYPSLGGLFEQRKQLVWHQDEPFGSTSIFAQWEVFKLANQQQVKVMLDGQGADEQLAGYHNFFPNRFYELFSSLRWFTLAQDLIATQRLHGYSARHAIRPLVPEILLNPLRKFMRKPSLKADWVNFNLLNAIDQPPFPHQPRQSINSLSHQQLTQSNLPMLLHWEDRSSMAHSVESRTPFVDYRLIEFVLSLPSDFKLAKGMTKRVMREGMRNVLPEKIRTRVDKIGFATPEEDWIRKDQPEQFRKAVQSAIDSSLGLLNPSAIHIANDIITGKAPFHFLVWRLISFGDWMRSFSVKTQ